jgi:hypothetical protein
MTGLVFFLVFWVLAGACERHDVGVFLCAQFTIIIPGASCGFVRELPRHLAMPRLSGGGDITRDPHAATAAHGLIWSGQSRTSALALNAGK